MRSLAVGVDESLARSSFLFGAQSLLHHLKGALFHHLID
jgi:hypothetical protein